MRRPSERPASPHPYGVLLKQRRVARGLSLRELGRQVGLSHALLATVEAGLRRPLDPHYEPALVRALGNVTRRELDRARTRSSPLQLAVSNLSARDVGLLRALAARLERDELGPAQIAQLWKIITSRS